MKKTAILLTVISTMLLTGCTRAEAILEQVFLNQSGILEDQDYIKFSEYKNQGKLNANGVYDPEKSNGNIVDAGKRTGKVHVTFAENKYMDIKYYTDSELKNEINTLSCYLNPSDSIYSSKPDTLNPNSNSYKISEYRIREYDENNRVSDEHRVPYTEETTFIYQIPEDFLGTDISILPVGEYQDRTLSMKVFYKDEESLQHELNNAGKWLVNGKVNNGNNASISAIEPYTLVFDFDENNYFYVGSEPKPFTQEPITVGLVEFLEANPTEADKEYSVELQKYLSLAIRIDQDGSIGINNSAEYKIHKGKVEKLEKLKYGDSIIIETEGFISILDGDYTHVVASKDPLTKGFRYNLRITQDSEDAAAEKLSKIITINRSFKVNLTENSDYGVCTYKLDGVEVSGIQSISEAQKLNLTYKITNPDYEFAEQPGGIVKWINQLINKAEMTVTIPIGASLDDKPIDPDDWVKIIRKGE